MRGNGLLPVFLINPIYGLMNRLKTRHPKKRKLKGPGKGRGRGLLPAAPVKEFLAQVNRIAGPVCDAEGLELVHAEYQMEPAGKILRLYIDKPDGVTIDDCAAVSRQVSDLLDVYMEYDESYSLEVSSPGENRPIGKPADFDRFKGHAVRVKSARPIDGQKNFRGTLMGIEENTVKLMINDQIVAIDIEHITKARLINTIGES